MNDMETKKWWQRPENWVSALPFIGLGLLGILYANPILEWLIQLAQNVLLAAGLFGAIAVLGFLATSADLHRLLGLAYMGFIKRMTNIVYAVYPLEIMQGYLDDLKEKKVQLKKSLGDLRGLLTEMITKLAKKGEEHAQAMRMAKAATAHGNEPGMQAQLAFQARKADRLEKRGVASQATINKLKKLIALMSKVDEATDFMILDLTDTIKNEEEARYEADVAAKVMKAAQAILFSSKKRDEFDAALEANQRYVGMQMGLLEQFEEDTKNIITGIDLETDSIKLDALDKIDQMDKQLNGLFSGGTGTTKYRVSPAFRVDGSDEEALQQQAELEEQSAEETKAKRQSYADLYKN